jgi:hypothetical protein
MPVYSFRRVYVFVSKNHGFANPIETYRRVLVVESQSAPEIPRFPGSQPVHWPKPAQAQTDKTKRKWQREANELTYP